LSEKIFLVKYLYGKDNLTWFLRFVKPNCEKKRKKQDGKDSGYGCQTPAI